MRITFRRRGMGRRQTHLWLSLYGKASPCAAQPATVDETGGAWTGQSDVEKAEDHPRCWSTARRARQQEWILRDSEGAEDGVTGQRRRWTEPTERPPLRNEERRNEPGRVRARATME
jgi:hypothetical protein